MGDLNFEEIADTVLARKVEGPIRGENYFAV